uniref:Dickkopf N-terminal cysteine-rich domain-containing protein n=1 Tax=Clytia hemisphaerica TaxID=252671 RepID=A0A7M5ULT5_9CNID
SKVGDLNMTVKTNTFFFIFQSCSRNEECNKGNTCNLYSKKCERCRFREEICRRDGNCCDGLKCLWGRCREPITNGTEKSLCKSNEDCHSGLCCAKEHGVSVCKRYQKEGDTCEIPLGGLVFSLHHSCPCEQGLRCKVNRRNSDEFRQTNGRCIK